MYGMIVAGAGFAIIWGLYTTGAREGQDELRERGLWIEPLPDARIRRRRWW